MPDTHYSTLKVHERFKSNGHIARGKAMSYQVIARKWRPPTFSELIGQNHIRQTLKNALKENRLPHAILFTGPRGTGKTSSARILAKSLRCTNTSSTDPCSNCNDAKTGFVTFIQRFGGSLNLNIHFHMLCLDGVYTFPEEKAH